MERKIKCAMWSRNGLTFQYLTVREVVTLRNQLREQAFKYLAEDPAAKHIVYYRDRRDNDDRIWQAHFYLDMSPLDDYEFYARTEDLDGFIGAVHRHE